MSRLGPRKRRLTAVEVARIRRLFKEGVTKNQLCIRFGIGHKTITRIVLGYSYETDYEGAAEGEQMSFPFMQPKKAMAAV